MQPLHTIFIQNSLYVFNFYRLCQVSIHSCCQTLTPIVPAVKRYLRLFYLSDFFCFHGTSERSPPGIITNIHKNSFLYYHEIFYFAMHIPFQTLLFLFSFSENCNQRGAPENFFSNAPLRFLFSVRSIRNAPSPLPRRPARRYRLRTLCTDPESHHVFQAQWCVRRTGTW